MSANNINRESLIPLIGKKVDVDSKVGLVVLDVGEKFLYCRWPGAHHEDPTEDIPIASINRILWTEEIRHELLADLSKPLIDEEER